MRPSNNLENKTPSDTLKCLASMYDSSCSQFYRTTTEIQSGPDVHEESRLFMTFLTSFGVTEILCSLRLIIEGKTRREIPDSSLKFLEKFLANNFALLDVEDNTSAPLYRGGIAYLLLLTTKVPRPWFLESD